MNKSEKKKSIYNGKKNVDISGLINNNIQIGGLSKKIKKNNNINDNDSEIEDSEIDDSDNNDDSDEESDDNIDLENNEINIPKEDDEIEDDEDIDDSNLEDEVSDVEDKEEKDYIDNEETLKSKCYSKYARLDYEEIDFDELFGEETLLINKNIRLSKPILTKYEFVRLLTDRTKQLAQGAKPMLKNIEDLGSKEIAKLELKNKIIPLIIERPVPNSKVERWKLLELEIPEHFFSN